MPLMVNELFKIIKLKLLQLKPTLKTPFFGTFTVLARLFTSILDDYSNFFRSFDTSFHH